MLLIERIIIASAQAVWDGVGIDTLYAIASAYIASEQAVWDRVDNIYIIETLYVIARVYIASE